MSFVPDDFNELFCVYYFHQVCMVITYVITFNGPKMEYFYLPSSECALEYTGPVNELKDMCEIRIEVAGILRDCRVS